MFQSLNALCKKDRLNVVYKQKEKTMLRDSLMRTTQKYLIHS